jgi:hypothetical protein
MRIWKQFLIAGSCLVVALFAAHLSAENSNSTRFVRLPDVRLTQVEGWPTEAGDLVQFAAGAVEFRPPEGWWLGEIAHGREVRLVMAPEEPASRRRMPLDGIWITYHVAAPTDDQPVEELSRLLPRRIRLATSNLGTVGQPTSFELGPWPAVVAEFTVDSTREQPSRPSVRGRHILVRTEWGIFELHGSAAVERFEQRANLWAAMWTTIKLEQPVLPSRDVHPSIGDAALLVGSWKSYRSRMRLREDGRITIVPDSVNLLTTPDSPQLLSGNFQAQGDLLFVTWDDGSQLNFRWRARGSDLFLTDHEGQISQLKRLLE